MIAGLLGPCEYLRKEASSCHVPKTAAMIFRASKACGLLWYLSELQQSFTEASATRGPLS